MNIQNVIGELLSIGISAEKRRCGLWDKKTLRKHIMALNELQKCLQSNDVALAHIVLEKFITLCEEDYEIGKCYPFSNKRIGKMYSGENKERVNQLMDEIFLDLLTEIRKPFMRRKKVGYLLRVLHNLPDVYLGKNIETLCELNREGISEQDAIEYAFMNMDSDMVKKYHKFLSDRV